MMENRINRAELKLADVEVSRTNRSSGSEIFPPKVNWLSKPTTSPPFCEGLGTLLFLRDHCQIHPGICADEASQV